MDGLKQKTIRGGAAKLVGQVASLGLRIGSLVILARILSPADFGLVAMATVITGVLDIFSSGGLSVATVQQGEISDEQLSTLFWMNLGIGVLLALICLALAPLLPAFYNEPRLPLVMALIAPAFVINGAGVQHGALMQRQLRYGEIVAVEIASGLAIAVVSIAMALLGYGYWALVGGSLAGPLVWTGGLWLTSRWVPGRPGRASDVWPLLRFGGTVTLNSLVVYIAYNMEKVLLGRYFGPDALGLYGRSYQLINLPVLALNSAVGNVAFAALARLQHDPERFRNYFLKGYALVVSLTLPATIAGAVLADDIVLVMLGERWSGAAVILRYLAPTILVFGIINPLAWLLLAIGLQERSLKVALAIAPLVICAYLIGIPYGPAGVALSYSLAMCAWLPVHVVWCLAGSPVSPRDLVGAVWRPMAAGLFSGLVAWGAVQVLAPISMLPLVRLALCGSAMMAAYAAVLMFILGQRDFFVDTLRSVRATA